MAITHLPSIVKDGLVLHLDAGSPKSYSGSGTIWRDLSGNGNNGTLTNGPTFDSNNNGSIVFDGTNDYISFANSITTIMSSSNAVSIFAWFKGTANGIPTSLEIFHKRNNAPTYVSYGISWYRLNGMTFDSLTCRIGFSDGTVSDLSNINQPISQNIWTLGTQTFDGTNHNLYINGNIIASASVSNKTIKDEGFGLTMGSYNGGQEFFKGNISNGLIYNRALSPSEVLQNFNATKGRFGIK